MMSHIVVHEDKESGQPMGESDECKGSKRWGSSRELSGGGNQQLNHVESLGHCRDLGFYFESGRKP